VLDESLSLSLSQKKHEYSTTLPHKMNSWLLWGQPAMLLFDVLILSVFRAGE
jgi:hypothetical protein